ncbi:MAG: phosphoenolpyruvate synthase, partial [Methanobacteriales archaeon]|nr:phosphoenolpyruvate synthase [Methanobacteriales archaeon]
MEWEEIIEELPLEETATTLMTNLNIPSIADRIADYADGIGSVRIEHMVIETGKHPYRLLEEGKLTDVLKKGLEFVLESF